MNGKSNNLKVKCAQYRARVAQWVR